MLKFNVKNQILTRSDDFKVVADSKNYLTAEFETSDEWTGEITAVFSHGSGVWHVPLENGQCLVPWEAIRAPGFSVSLFCGDLITSTEIYVDTARSGFADGEVPGTPTPTIWQGYIAELAEENSKVLDGKLSGAVEQAKGYADENAPQYDIELTEETTWQGVQPAELKLKTKKVTDEEWQDVNVVNVATPDYVNYRLMVQTMGFATKGDMAEGDGAAKAYTDEKGEELELKITQTDLNAYNYAQSVKKIAVPYSDVRGTPTLELMHCLAGEYLRHFEINGKTSKNLIPYPYKNLSQGGTKTHEGITLTDNGDGSITADGTATGEAWIQVSVFDCAAGDFCLSGAPSGSSTATYFLQFAGIRDYGEGTAFTLDEEKSGTLYIYVRKGQTLSNVVFRPMLETGSTKSDYEIYGGVGDLDPSTNKYKIPIVFVKGGSSSEIIDVMLDTPLKEGETLDLIRQTRRSAEGETHIELSKSLPTLGGGNNNWLICNTAIKPAYMFAQYWRDISTSLTEIIYRIRNIESLLNIDGGTLSIDD